jgi:hypothetical protein
LFTKTDSNLIDDAYEFTIEQSAEICFGDKVDLV